MFSLSKVLLMSQTEREWAFFKGFWTVFKEVTDSFLVILFSGI